MTMIAASLLGGGALLWVAGEGLVLGSARLALRAGVTPITVGLTVVAFGTSAPEMVVSLNAARQGLGDIAIGNVVGSNICNIALILGLAALIRPIEVEARVIRVDVPVMLAVSLVFLMVLADEAVGRIEALGLVGGLLAYVGVNLWLARGAGDRAEGGAGAIPGGRRAAAWGRDAAFVVAGVAGLVVGGSVFLGGAIAIARTAGISEAVVGLTIVAVGTSLPELVTSVVAARRGHSAIAMGNVVGSNVFNILGIVGTAGAVSPFRATGVGPFDLAVMVGLAAILTPVAFTGRRVDRLEGALLLLAFVAYVAWRLNG